MSDKIKENYIQSMFFPYPHCPVTFRNGHALHWFLFWNLCLVFMNSLLSTLKYVMYLCLCLSKMHVLIAIYTKARINIYFEFKIVHIQGMIKDLHKVINTYKNLAQAFLLVNQSCQFPLEPSLNISFFRKMNSLCIFVYIYSYMHFYPRSGQRPYSKRTIQVQNLISLNMKHYWSELLLCRIKYLINKVNWFLYA